MGRRPCHTGQSGYSAAASRLELAAGAPRLGPMQDRPADVVIAGGVLAGEPTGYAELYDRYATPLYAYCHSILLDQQRAVNALAVTFMIAVCRLGELRDADRLRPWLYALARHECRCRADGS